MERWIPDWLSGTGDSAREHLLAASGLKVGPRDRPPMQVLFTVDTEISLGGALQDTSHQPVGTDVRILGQTSRGDYGVGRMMDQLESHGFVGVFFFEVNARNLVDEAALRASAKEIADRGHEVQLHLHPEFNIDLKSAQQDPSIVPDSRISCLSQDERIEQLKLGCQIIEDWTGTRPTAFRAGSFGAGDRIFEACAKAQLRFDSSANLWAADAGMSQMSSPITGNDALSAAFGVFEVPVTCFNSKGPRAGLRQFDLAATSVSESIWILESMYAAGARTATALTHSFRLLKATDYQYSDVRPDLINVRRLSGFFRYLSQHPDRFQVCGYNDLRVDESWSHRSAAHSHLPEPPTWASSLRLAVQGIKDRGAV